MPRFFDLIARVVGAGGFTPGTRLGAALIVLACLLGLCLSSALTEVEGNPASRLASIEALVDYHTWSIDDSVFLYVTVDKVRIDGLFYSSKPPLFAALGAVLYHVTRALTGWTFATEQARVVAILRFGLQVVPFLLGLVLAGRFLRSRIRRQRVWFWGFMAFALGTFLFGYSATVNNHAIAGLLVLASMVGVFRLAERPSCPWWTSFGTGMVTAMAVVMDFGAAIFAGSAVVFLLCSRSKTAVPWFLAGAMLPVLAHFHLTFELTGSLVPFYGQSELYRYPGSYWSNPRDFDALTEPTWVYAFHALVGHHGLFSMTPLFFWAIPGVITLIRSTDRKPEGWLIAISTTATIATYLFAGPRNYGGTAAGMRWFIILTPMLWYAALVHLDRVRMSLWKWRLFYFCVCLGMVNALAALTGPWAVSPWNWFLRYLGLGSVPPFRRWLPG